MEMSLPLPPGEASPVRAAGGVWQRQIEGHARGDSSSSSSGVSNDGDFKPITTNSGAGRIGALDGPGSDNTENDEVHSEGQKGAAVGPEDGKDQERVLAAAERQAVFAAERDAILRRVGVKRDGSYGVGMSDSSGHSGGDDRGVRGWWGRDRGGGLDHSRDTQSNRTLPDSSSLAAREGNGDGRGPRSTDETLPIDQTQQQHQQQLDASKDGSSTREQSPPRNEESTVSAPDSWKRRSRAVASRAEKVSGVAKKVGSSAARRVGGVVMNVRRRRSAAASGKGGEGAASDQPAPPGEHPSAVEYEGDEERKIGVAKVGGNHDADDDAADGGGNDIGDSGGGDHGVNRGHEGDERLQFTGERLLVTGER